MTNHNKEGFHSFYFEVCSYCTTTTITIVNSIEIDSAIYICDNCELILKEKGMYEEFISLNKL